MKSLGRSCAPAAARELHNKRRVPWLSKSAHEPDLDVVALTGGSFLMGAEDKNRFHRTARAWVGRCTCRRFSLIDTP